MLPRKAAGRSSLLRWCLRFPLESHLGVSAKVTRIAAAAL
jgi:hypothetical protein